MFRIDAVYHATKAIKSGAHQPEEVFADMVAWLRSYYSGVSFLNVWYDMAVAPPPRSHRPRLQIILEHQRDMDRFRDGYNFRKSEQEKVVAEFKHMLASRHDHSIDTDGLFAVFAAFDDVARGEANSKVTDEQIGALFVQLNAPELWLIRPRFEEVVFFFHTDRQLADHKLEALRSRCAEAYPPVVSVHDEFGYLEDNPIAVRFDSKQNFNKNYSGSWFNYDR